MASCYPTLPAGAFLMRLGFMARKKVCIDRRISLLLRRYLTLQDNSAAIEALESSRKRVHSWRYDKEPAFPDNPTALHQPTWFAKHKRGTFPHGFDKAGELVLIEWIVSIAIHKDMDHLEASFINVFGARIRPR